MNATMMKALANWRDFNEVFSQLKEDELKEMLKYELEHEGRRSFIERLHQRYNTLRVARERETLLRS